MDLNQQIVACRACPRLVEWRERVASEKRKSFSEQEYWGRPVPNFGDPQALGLIIGLAPAAHGANRTGRMFTGDRSGDWLYRAMHRAGLANQAASEHGEDGLQLSGVLITAVCHCAPPDNKPEKQEIAACRRFLTQTIQLRPWKAVLCLGGLAWTAAQDEWGLKPRTPFGHGAEIAGDPAFLASYHPSQQNTFTGRLTEEMLDGVMNRFAALIRAC